jgi:hypothetical protein
MSRTRHPQGSQPTCKPPPVAITLLIEAKRALEVVLERKVQRLGWEVADHVGRVATPQAAEALVADRAAKAVTNALVGLRQTTLLDHLVLVLDEQLHTLDGGSSRLGDGSRHATHHEILVSAGAGVGSAPWRQKTCDATMLHEGGRCWSHQSIPRMRERRLDTNVGAIAPRWGAPDRHARQQNI